jgi:hypothetical protein
MNTDIARQTLGDLVRRTRMRFPNKLAIRCGSIAAAQAHALVEGLMS